MRERSNAEPGSVASRSHTVRLRGPWECELYRSPDAISRAGIGASPSDAAEVLTIKLPVEWDEFLHRRSFGSMVLRRRFGRPTGLSDRERIELVIAYLHEDVIVWLNAIRIEPIARDDVNTRFELTNQLKTRNQIALAIQAASLEGRTIGQPPASSEASTTSPFGQVCLEILTDC